MCVASYTNSPRSFLERYQSRDIFYQFEKKVLGGASKRFRKGIPHTFRLYEAKENETSISMFFRLKPHKEIALLPTIGREMSKVHCRVSGYQSVAQLFKAGFRIEKETPVTLVTDGRLISPRIILQRFGCVHFIVGSSGNKAKAKAT